MENYIIAHLISVNLVGYAYLNIKYLYMKYHNDFISCSHIKKEEVKLIVYIAGRMWLAVEGM